MAGPDQSRAAARAPWMYGAIGALLALVVVLAVIVVMLLGNGGGTGNLAAATSTPTAGPTEVAVGSNGSGGPAATDGATSPGDSLPASAGATTGPDATPGATTGATPRATAGHTSPPATPRPSATAAPKPTIDSFTADPNYVTNCAPGSTITLSWLTTNADRVDIAVDIPAGESPLDHLYLDHQALDGSYSGLSYPCDAPFSDGTGAKYHNYAVIAYRGSAVAWKIIRVYVQPQV